MSEQPWIKFYPRDWRGDQALRAVSIAARGLWMECLCIMHEAKPYGHLMLNGEPVEDHVLARMAGVSVDEVSALMAELRQAGVLGVTSRGVVFSRRMTKDHARARKGKKAAIKRWSQVPDGVEQSGAPNGSPNGIPITQKPEARSQKQDSSSPPLDDPLKADFEEWYRLYPHKVGRGQALKAYRSARKKIGQAELLEAVKKFSAAVLRAGTEKRFVPHPSTWLTGERWADEDAPQPAQIAPPPAESRYTKIARRYSSIAHPTDHASVREG